MSDVGYSDPLVSMYYLATLPLRKGLAARQAAQGKSAVTVLFYHRVADEHPNDCTIPTAKFQAQIEWVRQRYEIISLLEAQHRIGSEANYTPAVCITFDDGYADNCREAIPWLLDERIPFTYFVSTAHVLEGRPFEHDLQRGCPLRPNTPEELRVLAEAGVELGAHTRRHRDLGGIVDEAQLRDEIAGSKEDLQRITHRAVRYFAFPFGLRGNMSAAAFRVAQQAGFWGVCSAYGGYNQPGDDPFHIRRVHGDPSWARFCNTLTGDPRVFRRVSADPGFDYQTGSETERRTGAPSDGANRG